MVLPKRNAPLTEWIRMIVIAGVIPAISTAVTVARTIDKQVAENAYRIQQLEKKMEKIETKVVTLEIYTPGAR